MSKPTKWRAPGNYDEMAASDDAIIEKNGWGPSLTIQSHAEDNDLNVLMKRMGITGQMPVNPRIPMYGDFTEIKDYRTALHAIMDADEKFAEYPAELRAKFDNDPQKFLEWTADENNKAEMHKLGLLRPDYKAPGEAIGGGAATGVPGAAQAGASTPAPAIGGKTT